MGPATLRLLALPAPLVASLLPLEALFAPLFAVLVPANLCNAYPCFALMSTRTRYSSTRWAGYARFMGSVRRLPPPQSAAGPRQRLQRACAMRSAYLRPCRYSLERCATECTAKPNCMSFVVSEAQQYCEMWSILYRKSPTVAM